MYHPFSSASTFNENEQVTSSMHGYLLNQPASNMNQHTFSNQQRVYNKTSNENNAQLERQRSYNNWEEQTQQAEMESVESQRSQVMPPKKTEKQKDTNKKCALKNCVFCTNGTIPYLQNIYKPGWRESAIAAFKGILASDSSKGWLSLTDDIYPLFESHWDILCPSRKERDDAWRKHLQDALSHNKKYFVSGKEVFGQTGYWRLRLSENDNSPALPDPQMGLPRRPGKRGSDEYVDETVVPSVKRDRVTIISGSDIEQTISQPHVISVPKPAQQIGIVQEERDIPSDALSNVMNNYEVLPNNQIGDLQMGLSMSKEFGWHFSNFLSRAKIINTSFPQATPPPQSFPQTPSEQPQKYTQISNLIHHESNNRRYSAGKIM